jgi:hypothetical protein
MAIDTAVFHIHQATGFFHDVNTLLIALQGVAVASELVTSGSVQHNSGDYVTIEARYLNSRIRLPLVGPIQAAIANRLPDLIEISIVSGRDKEQQLSHYTSGFQRFVDSIFLPFLVAYHERHRDEIEKQYPAGRMVWPSAWQMSWALRNAASHNGRVFKKPTQQPVSWRGLTFSPSDEATITLLELVNGGDLLALMIDMEEERTGASLQYA